MLNQQGFSKQSSTIHNYTVVPQVRSLMVFNLANTWDYLYLSGFINQGTWLGAPPEVPFWEWSHPDRFGQIGRIPRSRTTKRIHPASGCMISAIYRHWKSIDSIHGWFLHSKKLLSSYPHHLSPSRSIFKVSARKKLCVIPLKKKKNIKSPTKTPKTS